MNKKYYSTMEIAELTGKHYTYISQLLRTGLVIGEKMQKVGRNYIVPKKYVIELVGKYKPENLYRLNE